MTTRAKFKVTKIERTESCKKEGDKYVPCEMRTIVMVPVYANGDPNHENSKFWASSPSGSFQLSCVNLPAVEHFELGKEYYIDITPAPAAA